MSGSYWYWHAYVRGFWYDAQHKYQVYGWRAFLPHRHIPHRYPAGDGWYCRHCGTRKAIVQRRGYERDAATWR